MKKMFLVIICAFIFGCAGDNNYGNNGVIKGQIFKGSEGTPPGVNCEVIATGTSGYIGPEIRMPVDPNTGNFEASINLGARSDTYPVAYPIEYVPTAQFNLYLKVKGIWISPDTSTVTPFYENVRVEAGRPTDIGPWVVPSAAF